MKYYRLKEACRLLDINASTLYRWCRRAAIEPATHPSDHREKSLSRRQLTILARMHHRVIFEIPETSGLEERLDRLECLYQQIEEVLASTGILETHKCNDASASSSAQHL
jgi:transposase-like protein